MWCEPPRAKFSDCGTFVLLAFKPVSEPPLVVIHKLDAVSVTTRYYPLYYPLMYEGDKSYHITPCGEYVIETEEVDRTSHRLVSRKLPRADLLEEDSHLTSQHQDDQQVHLENVICYPSRLAKGYGFLLLGKNDDEKMHLLNAPREGRALEIRPLSLSFNEAKRRLEAEWEKRRALRDKGIGGTGEQSAVTEEDTSEDTSEEN